MNNNERNPVIVTESDFLLLKELMTLVDHTEDEMSFSHELARAIVMKDDAFPSHAIKLHSMVTIIDVETRSVQELSIVLPDEADKSNKRISVLSPLGTALIGFRKKETVYWKSPSGMKAIEIIEVVNVRASDAELMMKPKESRL